MAFLKFGSLVLVAVLALSVADHHHREDMKNWKCKPSPEQIEMKHNAIATCYKDITGSELPSDKDEARKAFKELPEDVQKELKECAHQKINEDMLNADGSFNMDQIKLHVNKLDATDEIKTELANGIDECFKAGTDKETLRKCKWDLFKKVCKGDSKEESE